MPPETGAVQNTYITLEFYFFELDWTLGITGRNFRTLIKPIVLVYLLFLWITKLGRRDTCFLIISLSLSRIMSARIEQKRVS